MMYAPLPDGGRLAYSDKGDGPALLLLRPLGGSIVSWSRFGEELARRTRVVSFDYRGAGDSSQAPPRTTTRSMARDVISLQNHLEIEHAHIYGISMGGMVASWLAIDSPDRVNRLVLASTLPRGLDVNKAAAGLGISLASCFLGPSGKTEGCMSTRILSKSFREEHPEEIQRIKKREKSHPAFHKGLQAFMTAIATHDARSRLHDIKAETLVLFGENDPLLTFASQVELMQSIPNASHRVIPGAGHDLSVEAPEETAALVLAHIGDA